MKKEFDMQEIIFDINGYQEFNDFLNKEHPYIRVINIIIYIIAAVGAKAAIYIKDYNILPIYLIGFCLNLSLDVIRIPSIYMRIKAIQLKKLGIDRDIHVIQENEYIDILGRKKTIRLFISNNKFYTKNIIVKTAKKIETKNFIFFMTNKRGFFIFSPKANYRLNHIN